ncbi:MAG: hypothetical protein Q7R49_00200 [Candidatus Daviesbacteria bacterium]|nr:hypothetical protein [Candidatus Daviesbacteria bacterium]
MKIQNMLGKKQLQFGLAISMFLIIALLGSIIYLWFIKIPELNKNLTQLNSKLETEKINNAALLDAARNQNTTLEANLSKTNQQFQQVNQQVSQNTKDIACKKVADTHPLPQDMPTVHNYDNGISPKEYSIKGYVDFYKEQVQNDVISKNLPPDALVGDWWVKADRNTKATASDVLAALKFIEDKYTEYLANVKICGK